MARVAGVDLPRSKPGFIALRTIYGIGRSNAWEVLAKADIEPHKRVSEWSEEEIARLRTIIEQEYTVEGQLRAEVQMNIRRLVEIGSYRGMRHKLGLPVRGQRTRTNARTRKGRRKTVAGKKKAPRK